METPLHQQKVAILDRLLKESSLTLEEALVLLHPGTENVTDDLDQPITEYTGTASAYVFNSTDSSSTHYTYIITDFID